MNFREISIDSPITEKIRWALNCYEIRGDVFLGDSKTNELLVEFRAAVASSRKEMAGVGIENECRECEEKEGGSCCGKGIENRYSGSLILVNLLLGLKLPENRCDPEGCFFLGERGCPLLARHVICINYLCKKITDRYDPETLSSLREKEGAELERLFLLNERVREIIKGL